MFYIFKIKFKFFKNNYKKLKLNIKINLFLLNILNNKIIYFKINTK